MIVPRGTQTKYLMKTRKRVNRFVLRLAQLYNVSYYIAQKFYNKANGVIEEAKVYLKLYTLSTIGA